MQQQQHRNNCFCFFSKRKASHHLSVASVASVVQCSRSCVVEHKKSIKFVWKSGEKIKKYGKRTG